MRLLSGAFGILAKVVACASPLLVIGALIYVIGVLDSYYYDPVPYVKPAVDLNLDNQVDWKELMRSRGMNKTLLRHSSHL